MPWLWLCFNRRLLLSLSLLLMSSLLFLLLSSLSSLSLHDREHDSDKLVATKQLNKSVSVGLLVNLFIRP